MSDKITLEKINAAVPPEEFGESGMEGYENAANYAVKRLLEVARRDPVAFGSALDEFRENPLSDSIEKLLTPEERRMLMEGRYGLSGFQYGWAVQTVAYFLEQAPVPNPAIITIGVRNDD